MIKILKPKDGIGLLRKFLISYLLILLIPLILTSLAYRKAVKVIERDSREARLFMLRQTRNIMDSYFREIDELTYQMATNPKMNEFTDTLRLGDGSPDVYKVWEFYNDLKNRTITNNAFKGNFYIFLRNNSLVFSYNAASIGIPRFYENALNYRGMEYHEWYQKMFGTYNYREIWPSATATVDSYKREVITYIQSLPIGYEMKQNVGAIMFLIDDAEIKKLLIDVNLENSGWVYIEDEHGRIITGITNGKYPLKKVNTKENDKNGYSYQKIYHQQMMVASTQSAYNDWNYVAVLPMAAVMGKVNHIKRLALVMAGFSLIVGLIIAYLFAYRNSKPINKAISTLKDFFSSTEIKKQIQVDGSEENFLQKGVSSLINDHGILHRNLEEQREVFKTLFLDRLLKGDFDNEQQMESLLANTGLNLNGTMFSVVIIKVIADSQTVNNEIFNQLEVLSRLLKKVFSNQTKEKGYTYILNENEIALLVIFNEVDRNNCLANLHNLLLTINNQVCRNSGNQALIGVGELYPRLFDANWSFREAKEALYYAETHGKTDLYWYARIKKQAEGFFYPAELEIKLNNYAKCGNLVEIKKILTMLFQENFINRSLTEQMEDYFLKDLGANIFKLNSELDLENSKNSSSYKLEPKLGREKLFEWLVESYSEICRNVEANKKSHNLQVIEQIMNYVSDNYYDFSLSISQIASRFNLSESYCSQLFKEQTGERFSNFLEKLRIKEACNLIAGNNPIEEIAERVGYTNTYSFRRAFKRIMGVAPSAYRDSIKQAG